MKEEKKETKHIKRPWAIPMLSRSPEERHRAATPLELFFDLVFVVAIAQAGIALHHGLAENHILESILGFTLVFFAIWWAWMNFTWFASAFDTDDVLYRLAVFVQMTGALILAAGAKQAFEGDYRIVTSGYIVMRLALVYQWIRAGLADPEKRTTAFRYAAGISLCQIGWIILNFVIYETAFHFSGFVVLAVIELLIPTWAEKAEPTAWHPIHIEERYGLFAIIVLGESILATSLGIQAAMEHNDFHLDLIWVGAGAVLILFSMWWLYFETSPIANFSTMRGAFIWGYGHFFVFASAAAVGSGLAVAVDFSMHQAEVSAFVASAAVSLPVAVYLASLWIIFFKSIRQSIFRILIPCVIIVALILPLVGTMAIFFTGLLMVGLLVAKHLF